MCIRAGVESEDIDDKLISHLLMRIYAEADRQKEQWVHTATVCFYIGAYGNCDPKKFPKSIGKFIREYFPMIDDEEANPIRDLKSGYDRMREAKKRLAQNQDNAR